MQHYLVEGHLALGAYQTRSKEEKAARPRRPSMRVVLILACPLCPKGSNWYGGFLVLATLVQICYLERLSEYFQLYTTLDSFPDQAIAGIKLAR